MGPKSFALGFVVASENRSDLLQDANVPQPKSVGGETRQDIDRMRKLTGAEFDREYVNTMVADHKQAIEMFRDQQTSGQDPSIVTYAGTVLPMLKPQFERRCLL